MLIEIIFIFGIPAIGAVLINKFTNSNQIVGNAVIMYVSLAGAFIVSWAIFIFKFKRLHKEMVEVEDAMRQHKKMRGETINNMV